MRSARGIVDAESDGSPPSGGERSIVFPIALIICCAFLCIWVLLFLRMFRRLLYSRGSNAVQMMQEQAGDEPLTGEALQKRYADIEDGLVSKYVTDHDDLCEHLAGELRRHDAESNDAGTDDSTDLDEDVEMQRPHNNDNGASEPEDAEEQGDDATTMRNNE